MIVTIDGPVASGKSTVARAVARQCNFYYINSGLMFRAYAYVLTVDCAVMPDDIERLTAARIAACVDICAFEYRYANEKESISYCDRDLTPHLKDRVVDQWASRISALPPVRELVLAWERKVARNYSVVLDGRDAGSVVFPNAEVKIFLTASLPVRVQRWLSDQRVRGNNVCEAEALAQIIERDERDRTREAAPLVVPAGALTVDSTALTTDEVVSRIVALCTQKLCAQKKGG